MKVAVVAGAFHRARQGVYGSESQAAVLARGFERAGHAVTFIAAAGSDPVGRFLPVPCMYGIIYPNEETKGYDWYKGELREMDFIVDWSGTHRVAEEMYFWERERFKGVLVWSHQGNTFTSPRPPAINYFHGTVVSEAQKEHAFAHWIFNTTPPRRERVHVLPYGIDTETYHPAANPTRDYFLYLSRPVKDKGIFEFLELARDFPNERFVMAFDMAAPDHVEQGTEAIRQAKADHPNVEYVPLKGSVETKVRLYQNAKALVTPLAKSYLEGFGLVFAEAMACGTPCITATHGGQVDVIGDLGGLCETHEQYVEAIRSVAEGLPFDPAEKVRERIVRKFGIERWVAAYLKLYAKIRREQDTPEWTPLPDWMFA